MIHKKICLKLILIFEPRMYNQSKSFYFPKHKKIFSLVGTFFEVLFSHSHKILKNQFRDFPQLRKTNCYFVNFQQDLCHYLDKICCPSKLQCWIFNDDILRIKCIEIRAVFLINLAKIIVAVWIVAKSRVRWVIKIYFSFFKLELNILLLDQ